MTDLLLLAMSRLPGGGVSIAGMTTEPDPITGLRWVRPITHKALTLEDLRYVDGTLPRLGDVLALELGEAMPEPPYIENVMVQQGFAPTQRIRSLSAAKRLPFFNTHLDPAPEEILRSSRSRSLCLVKPDDMVATFAVDEETGVYEARLVVHIGRLHSSDQGVLVTDLYWRAWGRQLLGDEPFAEFDAAALREQAGDLFVVIGLNRKGAPVVVGVHPAQSSTVELDEDAL
ncbi:MAG: hypothetical protein H0X37_26115 [Herpetosiphonaceae bacterium]|nr:hypothetical protein [Herpetosiphonaceae bacterium]